jgi:serine protease inhibitor ecotin
VSKQVKSDCNQVKLGCMQETKGYTLVKLGYTLGMWGYSQEMLGYNQEMQGYNLEKWDYNPEMKMEKIASPQHMVKTVHLRWEMTSSLDLTDNLGTSYHRDEETSC